MGAQWKHAGRIANSSKRGAHIGKLVKEVIVAAKVGDPNPDNNARLRAAVEAAKKGSVPRDTLERAIKKGAGLLDDQTAFEIVTYEGFAPGQVPVIVECLTDNKNRTASDIRLLFRKGQLGAIGSVAWMFDRWGVVDATHLEFSQGNSQDIEGVAIEAGAQNVEPLPKDEVPEGSIGARFYCDTKDLDAVSKFLTSHSWTVTASEMSFIAKNYLEPAAEVRKEIEEFLFAIDEHDDVHRVYVAMK